MPEIPDADTQTILDDMKKDGAVPESEKPEEKKENPPAETPPEKEEEKPKETPPAESENEEEEKEGRKVLFVPVGQVKAEKKALENRLKGEFQTQIDALKTTVTDLTAKLSGSGNTSEDKKEIKQEISDEVRKVADKWGVEPEMVLEIVALVPKPAQSKADSSMSDEDKETLYKQRERDEAEYQTNQFNAEFVGSDENPGVASNEEIKRLVEDRGYTLDQAKAKLYEFVFSTAGEAYAKIPLTEILQMKLSTLLPQKKKSAENGRGGSSSGAGKQSDKKALPTKEEMDTMSDEEFLKRSNELGQGSGLEIRRVGGSNHK